MTRKPKHGTWVQVTFVTQMDLDGLVAVADGVMVGRSMIEQRLYARIDILADGPDQPRFETDRSLRQRAVNAELDAATARSAATVAERDRETVRRYFDKFQNDAAAERLTHEARTRLLTALLARTEVDHTSLIPLSVVYADAIRNPCWAYREHIAAECWTEKCGDCDGPDYVHPCCVPGHGHNGNHVNLHGQVFTDEEASN